MFTLPASLGALPCIPRRPCRQCGHLFLVSLRFFVQHGLNFGLGIEPIDQPEAFFTVFDAAIEFFADGFGEAGDFAGSSCVHTFFLPQRRRGHGDGVR